MGTFAPSVHLRERGADERDEVGALRFDEAMIAVELVERERIARELAPRLDERRRRDVIATTGKEAITGIASGDRGTCT